jgi:HEAT repeat protein
MKLKIYYLILTIAAASVTGSVSRADEYDDLMNYDWDKDRTPLTTIETTIREATTDAAKKAVEDKLIKVLESAEAKYAAKQFACRALRKVGSEVSVPALAKLLTDEKLSHMARFALQRETSKAAGDALFEALAKAEGDLRIGIIGSLSLRRDKRIVPEMAKFLSGGDETMARVAIDALGNVACADCAKALSAAKVPEKLRRLRDDSLLKCADSSLAGGDSASACAIYKKLFAPGNILMIRVAALRGIVLAEKEKSADMLIALLADKEIPLQRAARRYIIEIPGTEATKALASKLASLQPGTATQLIDMLTERGDPAASLDVSKLINHDNEEIRTAAIKALAVMGDATCVPVLAKAASGGGAAGDAAVETLNRIKGKGVGQAMAKLLDSPDASIRAGIIKVMTARADRTVAPAMVKAAGDKDEKIRAEAIRGLAVVAGPEELPGIVNLLVKTAAPSERTGLAKAMATAAMRSEDVEASAEPITAGMAKAGKDARLLMIKVLGRLGGAKALDAIRIQLASSDPDTATEAVRALETWPDPAPAPDLLKIIKTSKDNTRKALAFRGYINMANLKGQGSPDEAAKMYEQALGLASNTSEKQAVLGGLSEARSAHAIRLAEKLMDEQAVRAEAELAIVQISNNLRQADPDAARGALKKVIAGTKNDSLRKRAQGIINEMDKYRSFVTTWLVSGPYSGGFNDVHPPEKKDAKAKWSALTKGVGPQTIDIIKAIGGDNRAAYFKTAVFSPADKDIQLEMGSDDGIKVWINGKVAHSKNAMRGLRIGEDKAKAKLGKGWNSLLVKITQGGGDWGFCLRICNADGSALEGIKIDPSKAE